MTTTTMMINNSETADIINLDQKIPASVHGRLDGRSHRLICREVLEAGNQALMSSYKHFTYDRACSHSAVKIIIVTTRPAKLILYIFFKMNQSIQKHQRMTCS